MQTSRAKFNQTGADERKKESVIYNQITKNLPHIQTKRYKTDNNQRNRYKVNISEILKGKTQGAAAPNNSVK